MPAMVPDDDSMNDPCATPQSGAWSAWTMSHPTHALSDVLVGNRIRELYRLARVYAAVKETWVTTLKVGI